VGPYYYHATIILTGSEAFPHMATNDDEYDGYYIPKGTFVFGNAWSVPTLTSIFCPDIFLFCFD
jgi:hypothetical protein